MVFDKYFRPADWPYLVQVGNVQVASDNNRLGLLKFLEIRTQINIPLFDTIAKTIKSLA
jgi:hypothetical protein